MLRNKILLVTGGLGFIGKNFINRMLKRGHFVHNIDAVTYASDRTVVVKFDTHPNYQFTRCRIEELEYLPICDYIVNFAAESHVDNSIAENNVFCDTNILGVHRLLELLRQKQSYDRPKLIHISTDEVYGDIKTGTFTEKDILNPSSPYSASKAAADMLINAWGRTYGINYHIVRMTNVYGPHQYPEKLIPRTCFQLARCRPAFIHGSGTYIRTWLDISDAVSGLETILLKGRFKDKIYNMSGNIELTNMEVISKIISLWKNRTFNTSHLFVKDRKGQDLRYAVNDNLLRDLGWSPIKNFDDQIVKIIRSFDIKRFIQPWDAESISKSKKGF